MPPSFSPTISIDPVSLTSEQNYALLTGIIIPRPIALVSSISATGVRNLAPFSFFMAGGANPPSIVVSPVLGAAGQQKDTLENVLWSQEFVVNLVDLEMGTAMNAASRSLASTESEWDQTSLTKLESELVLAPRIAEAKISLECKLFRVIEHGNGPISARYVIGQVVRYHINCEMWDPESMQIHHWNPIARLSGPDYLDLEHTNRFRISRPQ